jgi:hypothetical protein
MRKAHAALAGAMLYILMLIPQIRRGLESVMAGHMLVQIPVLIISGYLIGIFLSDKFKNFFQKVNADGVPGILLFISIVLFWMLPRSLDGALNVPYYEVIKFLSLPFLAGVPFADSWRKLNYIFKGFIILNAVSMFVVLSWLYIASPFRLCNNYLQYQQIELGRGFLILIALFIIPILYRAFFGHSNESQHSNS